MKNIIMLLILCLGLWNMKALADQDGLVKVYYDDGHMKSEVNKIDGTVKTYYENGQLQAEGIYKNGRLEGPFRNYYANRKLQAEGAYKDGEADGLYREYYDNGKICKIVVFKDNKQEGLGRSFFKNGQLQEEGTWKDGKLEGPFKIYYENGKIQTDGNDKDGKLDGQQREYYESGKVKSEGVYDEDKKDGPYKLYYENGHIDEEGAYKDDKKEGLCRENYDNGMLKGEGIFKEGKKEGLWRVYYQNGHLQGEVTFKDDKPDGPSKNYYEDGKLQQEWINKVAKAGSEEFYFVDSYLSSLQEYSDFYPLIYLTSIPLISGEGYQSQGEVINSSFMKVLKDKQIFISKMIHLMEKYSDSSVPEIKNAANIMLNHYQKILDINTKAQDTYFYTQTGQFKAGLSTPEELSNDDDFTAGKGSITDQLNLIFDILASSNGYSSITCEEKKSLIKVIEELKGMPTKEGIELTLNDAAGQGTLNMIIKLLNTGGCK